MLCDVAKEDAEVVVVGDDAPEQDDFSGDPF